MFGYKFIAGLAVGYWLRGSKLSPALDETLMDASRSLKKIYNKLQKDLVSISHD